MRICILSYRSYTYSGGQGVYLRYLSSALRDLGHKVDIVSGPPYPELDHGIKLIKLPSLDLYTMPSVRRLFINPRRLDSFPNIVEWLGIMTKDYGETVIVKHKKGYATVYTNLGIRTVAVDDQVKMGDQLDHPPQPF